MANSTVAQAVNRQSVAAALRDARAKCAASQRWLNAVNRAALNLEALRWSFDGDTLRIESATKSGTFYTATAHTCECKAYEAGRPCHLRAATRLLVRAAELAAPVPAVMDAKPTMAVLQAAADELFS